MKKLIIGIILILFSIPYCGTRAVKEIQFDRNVEGYLKRAADANTIPLAEEQLAVALKHIESHGMTSGYTSVIYRTPNEDVGFWYKNLAVSMMELKSVKSTASQLEKSNMLMKLRETLLDDNEGDSNVTFPPGISVFPNNLAYAFFLAFSCLFAFLGSILISWEIS